MFILVSPPLGLVTGGRARSDPMVDVQLFYKLVRTLMCSLDQSLTQKSSNSKRAGCTSISILYMVNMDGLMVE